MLLPSPLTFLAILKGPTTLDRAESYDPLYLDLLSLQGNSETMCSACLLPHQSSGCILQQENKCLKKNWSQSIWAATEHKSVGNQVLSVLVAHETICFSQRSVSMPQRSKIAFFVDNLRLSFIDVFVCIQNKRTETDLYNKWADTHLCFNSQADQLFILTLSTAKQTGLIPLPILAKPRLLSLVPEGSSGRQSQLPLGHRQSSSMAWCDPEAVIALPVFVPLSWGKKQQEDCATSAPYSLVSISLSILYWSINSPSCYSSLIWLFTRFHV